jgi:hypothetical protein
MIKDMFTNSKTDKTPNKTNSKNLCKYIIVKLLVSVISVTIMTKNLAEIT